MSALQSAGAPHPDGVDAQTFRAALKAHASGVAILTAATLSGPVGVTITSLASLSAAPALVSFALASSSSTADRILPSPYYGIQLLRADQADLADLFARPGADRFQRTTAWRRGPNDVPLLDDCLVWLICKPHSRLPFGDHQLFVCSVMEITTSEPGSALVHFNGGLNAVEISRQTNRPTTLSARS